MTLYLKYRPQTLDELDLESVRTQLRNIILSGNVPHAFLFSGPKGTGKTSAARILAKVINCLNLTKDGEPCNTCTSCLSITKGDNVDIIELDAASNRGIDDIRNLKEGIYLSPLSVKKKIYIIDEVHMLTIEAANAFLKTLEEPPEHVVFILATTNPEKLPDTVVSRLTRIDFTKASAIDIKRQLKRVAKGENISISDEAITKIAKLADGSFRDAVKILETLSFKTKDIKEEDVSENDKTALNFFDILATKDAQECLEFIENLIAKGVSLDNFLKETMEIIHVSILAKNGIGEDLLTSFNLEDLIKLNTLLVSASEVVSPIAQLPFEIAIVKFCKKDSLSHPGEVKTTIGSTENKIEIKIEKPKPIEVPKKAVVVGESKSLDNQKWQKVLENIKGKNISIEALLRTARPLEFDGQTLKIGVYYKFHKEKLEDNKNLNFVEKICMESFNLDSIKLVFELIDKPVRATSEKKSDLHTPQDKDIINAAKEIFG